MKITIKNGEVKRFTDTGSIADQLKNMEALVIATQKHAANMQKVSARTLGIDPALEQANDALRRQLRCAENTIATADRQLQRQKGGHA